MTSKMISIKEKIYRDLIKLKGSDESFSDVIERLIKDRKRDPLRHYGIFKDLPQKMVDDFERVINEARKDDLEKESNKNLGNGENL